VALERKGMRTPWYTLALACTTGQMVCWTCLAIFYSLGRSNKETCVEVSCRNANKPVGTGDCGGGCTAGIPFFSYCGYEQPEYYVFGVGLTLVMLLGLPGVESVNRMYLTLSDLCGMPTETNLCWYVAVYHPRDGAVR
jgi:hypothetical protein